jgi:hypothetical protein
VLGEALAVGGGVGVVLAEDVLLDAHHAFLREAGRVGVGGPQAVVDVALVFVESVVVHMRLVAAMQVVMRMAVCLMGVTVLVWVAVAVGGAVGVGVFVGVFMRMRMIVRVVVRMFVTFDAGFALAAAAYRTHSFSPKRVVSSQWPEVSNSSAPLAR